MQSLDFYQASLYFSKLYIDQNWVLFILEKRIEKWHQKNIIHNSFSPKKFLFSKQIGKVRKFGTKKKKKKNIHGNLKLVCLMCITNSNFGDIKANIIHNMRNIFNCFFEVWM
jgi:hypothetical protein